MDVLQVDSQSDPDDRLRNEESLEEELFLSKLRGAADEEEKDEEDEGEIFMVIADEFRHSMTLYMLLRHHDYYIWGLLLGKNVVKIAQAAENVKSPPRSQGAPPRPLALEPKLTFRLKRL